MTFSVIYFSTHLIKKNKETSSNKNAMNICSVLEDSISLLSATMISQPMEKIITPIVTLFILTYYYLTISLNLERVLYK